MRKYDGFIYLLIIDIVISFNYITFNYFNLKGNLEKFLIYYILLSIIFLSIYLFNYKERKFTFWLYLLAFLIIKEIFIIYFYIGNNF